MQVSYLLYKYSKNIIASVTWNIKLISLPHPFYQIFHWLFKLSQEQPKIHTSTKDHTNYKETKGKDTVSFKNSESHRRSERGKGRKFGKFAILCGKDVVNACFNNTLNLRRLNTLNKRHHMKKKKEDIDNGISVINTNTVESTTQVVSNNNVLPVNETTLSSSTTTNDKCGSIDKSDKIKAMSRMKELLRWAAAAKSEKKRKFMGRKVLKFRSRGSIKAEGEAEIEREMSNEESPKISFGWEVERESCSTTFSSVCSAISMASSSKTDLPINMLSLNSNNTLINYRKGKWITTDSEFVVLEL